MGEGGQIRKTPAAMIALKPATGTRRMASLERVFHS